VRAGIVEQGADLKPKLSVIVPALRGYDSVLAALDSWEEQSRRDELEILVLCPTLPENGPLHPWQVLIATGSLHLHQARHLAILQAKADYVMLAEDHCLPDKLWAQAILGRLEEGWDAVGPALRSGNPTSKWTRAAFLHAYGQWMNPAGHGPVTVLPGHNAALRKQPLLDLGPELERDLLVSAFLLRKLKRLGQRFYLDDRATMRHFDLIDWKREAQVFYYVGLGFGSIRTSAWPLVLRGAYWIATPLIAARHWWRALAQYRRVGSQAGLSPFCLVNVAVLALAWACGEAIGALKGVDRVAPFVSLSEIKPVARSDV
jgi:hypothetical protein